ncbi:MAG: hypothetical protein R3Y13_03290 [bacterium]
MRLKEKITNVKNELASEEHDELKQFFVTVGIISVIIIIMFLFTKYVVNDGDVRIAVLDRVDGAVNYNITSIGSMLGKADKEYYVYAYSSDSNEFYTYQIIASKYTSQMLSDTLPVYYIDIDKYVNEAYLANDDKEENLNATKVSELALGEVTLIKVVNGKISKYLNTVEDIEKELAVTE